METLRLKEKAENGRVLIAVPKEMNNKLLEISVTTVAEQMTEAEILKNTQARGEALAARFGKAPHKEFILREDDVYYQ